MSENMTVVVEVWPVAVDDNGVWLLGPDALRGALPVPADSDPLTECKLLLAQHGIAADQLIEIHGTSTRTDGPRLLSTHYATVESRCPIVQYWPQAQPIDLSLAEDVLTASGGRVPPHEPLGTPTPRDFDVLLHALRHLWARLGYDQDAIDTYADRPLWALHLQSLAPALARMYGGEWRAAA